MGVKVIFLPDCPLVLSLLKHRDMGAFLNIKMRNPNRESPLNNSIEKTKLKLKSKAKARTIQLDLSFSVSESPRERKFRV